MSERGVGWLFVGAQVALLALLVLTSRVDHWAVASWIRAIALVLIVAGLALAALASWRLGDSLTASPVPRSGAELRTDGPYRWSRHPIYTGLLIAVAGLALGSGSLWTVTTAVIFVWFLDRKAAWEEQRLRIRFPGYDSYAARTPRFLPRPGRTRR